MEGGSCCPSADEFHHLLGGLDNVLTVFQLLGLDNPFFQNGDRGKYLLTVVVKVSDGWDFTIGDIASAFITSWPDLDGDLDGDLAGDLDGDLAGDFAGDRAGDLAGDLDWDHTERESTLLRISASIGE